MLLPTVAQARLPKIIHHSRPPHSIVILVGNIVIFTLKWLASGILAFAGNSANKLRGFENIADIRPREAGGVLRAGLPVGGWEIVQDGGEGRGGQSGEGELIGSVVADSLGSFVSVLGLGLGGLGFPVLVDGGWLSRGPGRLKGLGGQQAARRTSSLDGGITRPERGHTRKKVLSKWSEGMDDRIILFVIIGELFRSTQVTQLARPRSVKHSSSTTGTLGNHPSDSVVTLQWRGLILEHHYCSTRTRRRENWGGWGNGMLNSRRRRDRRCQTLTIQERTFLQLSTGLASLSWCCFVTGLF